MKKKIKEVLLVVQKLQQNLNIFLFVKLVEKVSKQFKSTIYCNYFRDGERKKTGNRKMHF
jgi:hypothetical protein